jgi:hypothetical protein
VPNLPSTWLISTYKSLDWKRGRQRLKIECATCSTPMLVAGSFDSFETRSWKGNQTVSQHDRARLSAVSTYIHKGIPALPEVTVGDHTDGIAQLRLDTGRHSDHQADQLALDGRNLLQRELVVSILVCPVALNEVLEAKGTSEANLVRGGRGRRDVEEL